MHDMSCPPDDRCAYATREEKPQEEQQRTIPGVCVTPPNPIMEEMRIVGQKAIWQNAQDHGWHNPPANLTTDLLLIHSEVSEACEALRKGKLKMVDGDDSVEEELADAVIRIFHVCEKNGFDIAKAVRAKHVKNIQRPFRHGNKAF